MRKLILTATCCACLAGTAWFLNSVEGQDKTPRKEAAADEIPHKIALIDMEYVFKNYEKLKYRMEELKVEAQGLEDGFKEKVKKLQSQAVELKDYKQDTPEYEAKVQKLQKQDTDLKFEQKQNQVKVNREVAKMNLEIYHEVHDVVERFCKQYNYTLVLQFSRSEANSTDPQRMQQIMSQQVIYYRKGDTGKCKDDLSEPVVKHLNREYAKNAGIEEAASKPEPKKDRNVKPAEGQAPTGSSKKVKNAD